MSEHPAGSENFYDTREWENEGFDASNSSKDEINAFIRWRIDECKKDMWRDDDLWDAFHGDFSTFPLQMFEGANSNVLRHLRNHMRENGVNVPAKRGLTILKALYTILEEEEPADWSEEQINAQLTKENFNSYRLKPPGQVSIPIRPTTLSPTADPKPTPTSPSPHPEPTQVVEQPQQAQIAAVPTISPSPLPGPTQAAEQPHQVQSVEQRPISNLRQK